MKKYLVIVLIISAFNQLLQAQNVGINSSGAAPAASAMLDIVATDKGLLVPRFALSDVTVAAPVVTPAVSLIVYNTATAGVTPNNVVPGFYYWDGTKWVAFSGSGGKDWSLLGNAGTVAGTNFLGTTDAQALVFKANNTERSRILSSGEFVIGSTTATSGDVFSSYGTYPIAGYASGNNSIAGYFAGGAGTSARGVTASSGSANGFGVVASNSNASGTGIIAIGSGAGGSYLTTGSGGSFSGVLAGLVANVTGATGTGIRASGQGLTAYPGLVAGSGGAFSGTSIGIAAFANNAGNNNWGGYFTNGNANGYAYVGGRIGGTDYKINGPGAVSTIVKNTKGEMVNMYCPEAPEILFQDFGKGKLLNGFTHIDLDVDFAKNITVNDKHPLRVIIQLEGDCKGVFVTNHSSNGFDVKELQGGSSSVSFTYFVTANRIDGEDENGLEGSKNADVRFGEAPSKAEVKNVEISEVIKTEATKEVIHPKQ
jgi:hypothetical protein